MTWIGDGAHTARRTARRHTSTYRYVNGFSISVKTQLHPGDTITFGTGPTSQSSSTLCALPPHTLRLHRLDLQPPTRTFVSKYCSTRISQCTMCKTTC
jgi:hypothetical protein